MKKSQKPFAIWVCRRAESGAISSNVCEADDNNMAAFLFKQRVDAAQSDPRIYAVYLYEHGTKKASWEEAD